MTEEGTNNDLAASIIDEENQYKVYPMRFLVVILYAFAQAMTSIGMNTLNPIATLLSEIYGEPVSVINLGGLLYILMHPFFTFPAAYVIDRKGVKSGIIVGSILSIIGLSLRMLINNGFWIVIAGQVLAGIGRPFILNCQAKVSANWFRAGKRGGVTQLLTLVINVSLIVGILIPGVFFKKYNFDGGSQQAIEKGKKMALELMILQAILAALCFLPNIIFQKEKPPTPPSQSADVEREPLGMAVRKLIKNRNFILLLFAFGIYFGLFNAISITLSQILKPWFGNDPLVVALVGGSPVISGILGVMILGPIQRRQRKFKKWIIICMIGTMVVISLFYPILQTKKVYLACLISALNSFFLIPLVPIMLQLGCQLVFPVGQGTAVGLLFAFGNLFGFVLGILMTIILNGGQNKINVLYSNIFILGLFVVGLILIIFMKELKNREKHEFDSFIRRKSLESSGYAPGQDYISTDNHNINQESPE